jgi:sugar phosphate isomerase/epimerase
MNLRLSLLKKEEITLMNKEEFSFSTCWNIKRHTSGRELIEEIKQLGFSHVELNYHVTKQMLASILPMVESEEIRISSVHHVFPFYDDKEFDPDSVMLGFENEAKRKKAVRLLKETIEHAAHLGAKGVVVHPGEVPFSYNIDKTLKEIYRSKGRNSIEYEHLWSEMIEKRERESKFYVKRIQESLEEVSEYIARKQYNVGIGLETRSRCYQIPTLLEANQMISKLKGAPVYLWYDIGHAMMMDRMGLYDNLQDLQLVKDKILGVHIHETIELSDHWCPYIHSQNQDFDSFIEVIKEAPIKVYELKSVCTPEEIDRSHKMIQEKMTNC